MTEPAIGSVEWWLHRQMSPAELVEELRDLTSGKDTHTAMSSSPLEPSKKTEAATRAASVVLLREGRR